MTILQVLDEGTPESLLSSHVGKGYVISERIMKLLYDTCSLEVFKTYFERYVGDSQGDEQIAAYIFLSNILSKPKDQQRRDINEWLTTLLTKESRESLFHFTDAVLHKQAVERGDIKAVEELESKGCPSIYSLEELASSLTNSSTGLPTLDFFRWFVKRYPKPDIMSEDPTPHATPEALRASYPQGLVILHNTTGNSYSSQFLLEAIKIGALEVLQWSLDKTDDAIYTHMLRKNNAVYISPSISCIEFMEKHYLNVENTIENYLPKGSVSRNIRGAIVWLDKNKHSLTRAELASCTRALLGCLVIYKE